MHTLIRFFRHNGWANDRTFDLCEQSQADLLTGAAKGTTGSIEQTLKHMVAVEEAYLGMVQGYDLSRTLGERERYMARELSRFLDRGRELASEYLSLMEKQDEGWLNTPLHVPWFDFPMTVHDGLIQVIAHSAQHRAQVLSVLGEHGIAVPDLDYVLMLQETHATAAP